MMIKLLANNVMVFVELVLVHQKTNVLHVTELKN